jgi:hypothetical protein
LSSSVSNHVPEPLARVADLMSTFGGMWSLCGGWAVDAWLGRHTRDHKDIDIAVFQDDLNVLLDHLADWQLSAHDRVDPDSTEQWDGRRLYLPAHVHARHEGADLDFQINERSGEDWLLSREPRIALDLRRCAAKSVWGLPTLVPEVILFYKAQEVRGQDETDFLALLPHVAEGQVKWLRGGIAEMEPGHPWLAQLSP